LNDERLMRELAPLFQSGAAKLNQLSSSLETMQHMFEKLPVVPKAIIIDQIQSFKSTIGTIPTTLLPTPIANKIYTIIDSLNVRLPRKTLVSKLNQLQEWMNRVVHVHSLNYLIQHNLYSKVLEIIEDAHHRFQ
jgi:hypothetical protein